MTRPPTPQQLIGPPDAETKRAIAEIEAAPVPPPRAVFPDEAEPAAFDFGEILAVRGAQRAARDRAATARAKPLPDPRERKRARTRKVPAASPPPFTWAAKLAAHSEAVGVDLVTGAPLDPATKGPPKP